MQPPAAHGDLRCSRGDNERQRPGLTVAACTGRTEGSAPSGGQGKRSEVMWRGKMDENHTDETCFLLCIVFFPAEHTPSAALHSQTQIMLGHKL